MRNKTGIIAAGIIIASLILAITSFWNDSLIVDEIPHVGSGYSYVKKLDYRLNPEHPPLAKALAAAPLLFLDLKQDAFQTKFWLEDVNGQWDFGRFLIFQSGNNADLITRIVKFPILIFFILSAILIYKWTRELYSPKPQNYFFESDSTEKRKFDLAPLIALILFVFSPTVLAHSRFVTTDIPALFGVLSATYFFLIYLRSPLTKNLWLAGLTFGIAMLTKFSTFLLIPYFLILAFIFGLTKKSEKNSTFYFLLSTFLIFIIGFVFIVWPVYYLFTFNYPPQRQAADTEFILRSFGNRTLAEINVWMADKPVIRAPGQYMLGLLMVGQRSVGGNTTYFLGEVSAAGWRHYFPVVYAIKEPLAWWILVVIALLYLAITTQIQKSKCKMQNLGNWIQNHFIEFTMLLWLAIYWITSIKSNLNIGVRHLLPTYPFVIILVSGQIAKIMQSVKIKMQNDNEKFKNSSRQGAIPKFYILIFTFLILFGWYIYESVKVWPYYLTYFNQLAGGSSGGYRYVVDSNLDWGQDLKRLSQWVEEKNIKAIHLDYFGWSDPAYYLGPKFIWLTAGQYKNAQDFINKTGGGYMAVSGTFFMGSRGEPEKNYIWLQRYEPVAVIGNSIWVWKF